MISENAGKKLLFNEAIAGMNLGKSSEEGHFSLASIFVDFLSPELISRDYSDNCEVLNWVVNLELGNLCAFARPESLTSISYTLTIDDRKEQIIDDAATRGEECGSVL
jgi:hypothetical protein